MKLYRVVVAWSGPAVVGNAVNVLHFDGSNQTAPPVAAIKTAYQIVANRCAPGTVITVPGAGDAIEDTTGALVGQWSGTGGSVNGSSAGAAAAAGVGCCVTWYTGGIVPGKKGPRRLRGRTFLVPLSNASFDANGTIESTTLADMRSFATALIGAGGLAVWHRPNPALSLAGNSYAVLSSNVRDKVAILTSRRD